MHEGGNRALVRAGTRSVTVRAVLEIGVIGGLSEGTGAGPAGKARALQAL